MPSLLDLEDDTIRLISHYTNRDVYIPLPSYGPHWQNFKSEINGKVARDLVSFRSTCKRIYGLSKLEGLHVNAKQWSRMAKWMSDAPREVERGVRRIKLCIPNSGGSDSIISFSTLINFLHRFNNLEELVIEEATACYHMYGYRGQPDTMTEFRLPLFSFLPKLRSLSIEVSCPLCSAQIPRILVPAAPNLKYLKFSLFNLPNLSIDMDVMGGPNVMMSSDFQVVDPFSMVEKMVRNWCKRNKQDHMELKALYLRYTPLLQVPEEGEEEEAGAEEHLKPIIKKTCALLPSLEELSITKFRVMQRDLAGCIEIRAKTLRDGWVFECNVMNGEEGERSSLQETIASFNLSANLKIFDPVFVITIPQKRPTNAIASRLETQSSYLSNRPTSTQKHQALIGKYENTMRQAIEAAAQILIDVVPSLEEGTFWEKGTERCKKDWNLWRWKKIIVNGVSRSKVEEVPEMLSREFVSAHNARSRQDSRMMPVDEMGMPIDEEEGEEDEDGVGQEDEVMDIEDIVELMQSFH